MPLAAFNCCTLAAATESSAVPMPVSDGEGEATDGEKKENSPKKSAQKRIGSRQAAIAAAAMAASTASRQDNECATLAAGLAILLGECTRTLDKLQHKLGVPGDPSLDMADVALHIPGGNGKRGSKDHVQDGRRGSKEFSFAATKPIILDAQTPQSGEQDSPNLTSFSRATRGRRQSLVEKGSNLQLELAECWTKVGMTHAWKRSKRPGFDLFAKATFAFENDTEQRDIDASRFEERDSCLQPLVIDPSSTFALGWSMVEVFLLSYDLITIPLLVFDLDANFVTIFMKYLSLCFWSSDMPISCFKGYVTRGGEVQMKVREVTKNYFRSRFLYDLLLLSIEWLNFSVTDMLPDNSSYASSSRFLRFFRFTRLLKVGKMRRLVENLLSRIHSNVMLTMIGIWKVMFMVYIFVHLSACGWYGFCSIEDDPSSWVYLAEAEGEAFAVRYLTCVQWAISQLGFGSLEIYPANEVEKWYSVFSLCISLLSSSWLVSSFVILMTRLQMLQKEERDREECLRDYLCKYQVTWSLRNRIWVFLRKRTGEPKKHVQESSVELIQHLPKAVVLELRSEVFIPILTVHPFFSTYAVSSADKMGMHHLVERGGLQEIPLPADIELFVEGEPAAFMYFLMNGNIVYTSQDEAFQSAISGNEAFTKRRKTVLHGGSAGQRAARQKRLEEAEEDDEEVAHNLIGPGGWLSEPALWLQWTHVGSAVAKIHCDIVALDVLVFQSTMQQDLPQAARYAGLFLTYARRHQEQMSDAFVNTSGLRSMAQDIFEPPTCFAPSECVPGFGEWSPADRRAWGKVWTTPYKDAHIFNRSALIGSMTTDMKNDAVLMFQTLFSPNVKDFAWSSHEDRENFKLKILFMKRLVLLLAVCGVQFTTVDNSCAVRAWPYPLAAALCHGGRLLMQLNGITWREVMNLLMFGDADKYNWEELGAAPEPLYFRRAATHGIRIEGGDGTAATLSEVKVKGVACFDRCHMGMDVPVGGLGNPTPPHKAGHMYVGPNSIPYKKAATARKRIGRSKHHYIAHIQHGHMYIGFHNFGKRSTPVLSFTPNPEYESPDGSASVPTQSSSTALHASDSIIDWTGLHNVNTTDALSEVFEKYGYSSSIGNDLIYDLPPLLKSELALEVNTVTNRLRLRGILVQLSLEFADNFGDTRVLAQTSVSGRPIKGNPNVPAALSDPQVFMMDRMACEDSTKSGPQDLQLVTILCRHEESWVSAIARYFRKAFNLCEGGIQRIIESCEQNLGESFLYGSPPINAFCWQHQNLVGNSVPLQYHVLRLTAQIDADDKHLFGAMLMSPLEPTIEENLDLTGLGGLTSFRGALVRSWEWLSPKHLQSVPGMVQRSTQYGLELAYESQECGSLLIGIESSAPLKDDLFGEQHSVDGKSKVMSAFGKRKWRDYRAGGQEVPADYGGVRVVINETRFQMFQLMLKKLELSQPDDIAEDDEKDLFKNLLSLPDDEVQELLQDKFKLIRGLPWCLPPKQERLVSLDNVTLHEALTYMSFDPTVNGGNFSVSPSSTRAVKSAGICSSGQEETLSRCIDSSALGGSFSAAVSGAMYGGEKLMRLSE